MITREDCLALDAADPLKSLRDHFALDQADASGLVYLDGNSLGPLPRVTPARLAQVASDEWGRGPIRRLEHRGLDHARASCCDKIARVVGAGPGEVVVADSTSANLYKVLSAAVALVKADEPTRRCIVSERTNFPSDLYIADTLARERGFSLRLIDSDDLLTQIDETVAVVMLTHVNYRTGRMHDLGRSRARPDRVGALMVWDLSHSVGAVPVDLRGRGADEDAADFAVGCGYIFTAVRARRRSFGCTRCSTERMDRDGWRQPLSGWLGHAAPFDFSTEYQPAPGIARFVCGTTDSVACGPGMRR